MASAKMRSTSALRALRSAVRSGFVVLACFFMACSSVTARALLGAGGRANGSRLRFLPASAPRGAGSRPLRAVGLGFHRYDPGHVAAVFGEDHFLASVDYAGDEI